MAKANIEDAKKTMEMTKIGSSSMEVDKSSETVAEVAKHRIQAGYMVAMANPRDVEEARVRILQHCKRPRFAETVEYYKPIGSGGVSGPTIRFAELALREWGNIISDIQVIYEDDMKRRSKVFITDLETNTTFTKEITIQKTVERKSNKGRDVLGSRKNSYGDTVYVVMATDDEIHNKEASLLSKALRNEGLRLIPTDIVDEALEVARDTLKKRDAKDPDEAKRRILDAFSKISIMPKDIKEYLGHDVSRVSEVEISELRKIYQTIEEGSASWEDYMAKKKPVGEIPKDDDGGDDDGAKKKEKKSSLRKKVDKHKKETAQKQAEDFFGDDEEGTDAEVDEDGNFI